MLFNKENLFEEAENRKSKQKHKNDLIMKKITLLVATILLTGSVANATEVIKNSVEERKGHFNFDEPISFIERGIEFFVFPNGDFDFNTRPQDSQGDYFYRTAGKRTTAQARRPVNYGVLIEHDSFGRVRRIGNTFINYDGMDRVKRIGTVYMTYNRFALTQIGGMHIVYNRRGEIVDVFGSVKGWRDNSYAYHYSPTTYYGSSNGYYNTNYSSNYDDDDNYYFRKKEEEDKR